MKKIGLTSENPPPQCVVCTGRKGLSRLSDAQTAPVGKQNR